ncbi:MAG: hypothetical protein F6J94_24250 [Moorea sp. SIO1F2]|uniref:hypothetical protein n=1 Tax=unclassified Moorena TaxID=2683338 RepID=UPI0013B69434|nr:MULTISPECIES: hypothetical protein [unclassified Moorena]NEN98683.1 hypothetical protein [Moorena sp. SIO3I7]NEO07305.1 hypothetical protein [Moorena sp. SIO3I8]NEP25547.1 hypothetical protein [Moorena sp. SIO3I6]NET84911.1 hypothetical protein [Moorena sp. SIO1F2]
MGITGTESSNSKNLKHSAISYQLMRYLRCYGNSYQPKACGHATGTVYVHSTRYSNSF